MDNIISEVPYTYDGIIAFVVIAVVGLAILGFGIWMFIKSQKEGKTNKKKR